MLRWLKLLGVMLIASRAFAVPCIAPAPPPGVTANYQTVIQAWIKGGCFTTWQADPAPRLSGAVGSDGATYTVHDKFRVYYSPGMVAWMKANRPDGSTVPSSPTPIPDLAAMVAAVYPISAPANATPSGYLVMIRQAGKRSTDPASGWFFSQIVSDPATFGGTIVTTSQGDYSMGLCVACHSSAVNNLTFASAANLTKTPPPPAYTPFFLTQGTSSLLSALTPPPSPKLRQPLPDGPAQQFIDFFNSAVREFQKKPLPPASSLPASKVLMIPPESEDDVYLRPQQQGFLTSNQCQGCHDTSALLSQQQSQYGQGRQWTPVNMSYNYSVQGPGPAPKGGDIFNISQYGEWSVSIMALASRDPAFLSQVETERVIHAAVEPTSVDNFCYRCHGPMGQRQYHIDHGGDPTQVPPGTMLKPEPNFSHFMTYSTPGGCMYHGFPCDKPGAQSIFAKYGALARDGISCGMCHHIGPHDGLPPTDPWDLFYGYHNDAVAGLESPLGFPYPFAGSMLYNLNKFAAPEPDPLQSYSGAATLTGSNPQQAQIFGHQQNFNGTPTLTRDYMPKGEFCGGCHVVIAPEIPIYYPQVRNKYQIQPGKPNGPYLPAMYPGPYGPTNKPCPPVKPGLDGKYDPTIDPCVTQSFEQTTYLEWAASASFGGANPQTSCTYCHMPNAEGQMVAIANIDTPGAVDGSGNVNDSFPKPQYRADDKVQISANGSYPRHRLMAINLFVHEMFQQFAGILGVASDTLEVPPGTIKNLQNAEETILTHAPTTVSVSVCKPGTANTPCSNLQDTPNTLTYQVTVQNFSGHRFPTGAGFRRSFLEFRLLDSSNKTLWVSGAVNPYGAIVDGAGKVLSTEFPPGDVKYEPQFLQPHFGSVANPAITRQDQVQIYEVRATNEFGQLTTATTRLFGGAKDNRIPPVGWVPPYNCSGQVVPGTADPKRMINGLSQFSLSRVTAPEGINDQDPSHVVISPDGAFSDPDYCTPGGVSNGQPTGIAGVDHVLYEIPVSVLNGGTVAKVQVIMHYQTLPPYFLRDRYYDGQTYSKPSSEGGVVGLGAATERLLYSSSHLDTTINNTIPQQQNLPNLVSTNWTMDIGSACFAEAQGVSCPPAAPPPSQLPERKKIQNIYNRSSK